MARVTGRLDRRLGLPGLEPGSPGDPGLFGPGSAVWRVGRERILLAGGPAALLLQVAHPLIAAAVAEHSDVARDPLRRLQATLRAVLSIAYGDVCQAEAAAAAVRAIHTRVRGTLAEPAPGFEAGAPYDASDPELGLWVHATLVWSALETFDLLVGRLGPAIREGYWQEAKAFARLFGVTDRHLPDTYRGFRTYFEAMVEGSCLSVGTEARALAVHILHPPVPRAFRPLGGLTNLVTAGLLPGRLRSAYGLRWRRRDKVAFRAAVRATRASIRLVPASTRRWPHHEQAVRRTHLDLSDDLG